MQQKSQPIAVLGATGAQGGAVVQALLRASQSVRAIARTLSHLHPLAEQGAEIVALDLTDTEALKRALDGVAGAFIHFPLVPLATTTEAQAKSVVKALKESCVPLAVLSTSGPMPTTLSETYLDIKLTIKQLMETSDTPVITLSPLLYLGNLMGPGLIGTHEVSYPLPADLRLPWISVQDQAQLAVAALDRPDLAGRSFAIGEFFTGPQLAEGIGAGLERHLRYTPLDPDAFGASLAPFLGEKVGALQAANYRLLASRPPFLALDEETASIRQELGVQATPLAVWAYNSLAQTKK